MEITIDCVLSSEWWHFRRPFWLYRTNILQAFYLSSYLKSKTSCLINRINHKKSNVNSRLLQRSIYLLIILDKFWGRSIWTFSWKFHDTYNNCNHDWTYRWSYMLYQLLSYYLTDLRNTITLWGYLGTTVIIFQNAAILEVSKWEPSNNSTLCQLAEIESLSNTNLSFTINSYSRSFMQQLVLFQAMSFSLHFRYFHV